MKIKEMFSGKSKGNIGGISTVIVALSVPLILILMFTVYAGFSNAIPNSAWTAAQNTTLSAINTGTTNSYQMANILPIAFIGVAILGSILGVLGGLFVMGRR